MLATATHFSAPAAPLASSPEVGLSAAALSALSSFMADQRALEEMAAAYAAADELNAADEKAEKGWSMEAFPELWGMSQFWNDEKTARTLARECVAQAKGGAIVLISSPSVFLMLKVSRCGLETEEPRGGRNPSASSGVGSPVQDPGQLDDMLTSRKWASPTACFSLSTTSAFPCSQSSERTTMRAHLTCPASRSPTSSPQ